MNKKLPYPANVKCDCGHTQKDHYQNSGWCHHSQHPKAGQCGCTFFYPNVAYIKRKASVVKPARKAWRRIKKLTIKKYA